MPVAICRAAVSCLIPASVLLAGSGCSNNPSSPPSPPDNVGVSVLVMPDGAGDYATIQAAVNAVADGDTVLLGNGIFTGEGNRHINLGGKAIVVKSRSGKPDSCLVDCESESVGFLFNSGETSSTILSGVTITRGHAVSGGGAYCWGSSPTLKDLVFLENSADLGGGVYCEEDGAAPTFHNVLFAGNSGVRGGGVYFRNGSEASLTLCTFNGNSAGSGGGLACGEGRSCSLTLSGCQFEGNSANGHGGGMACDDALQVTLIGCRFVENESELGGGLYMANCGSAVLTSVDFMDNVGTLGGGGVMCLHTAANLSYCHFEGNSATYSAGAWGGGMYVSTGFGQGHPLSVVGSSFVRNSADDHGGGLGCFGGHPTLTDCIFDSNSSGRSGGAVYCFDASLSGCVFYNNEASDWGGGVCANGDDSLSLVSCTLCLNSAGNDEGGGVAHRSSSGILEISQCVVAFSTRGEGVYTYGATPTISCTDIYGNADGDWVGPISDQAGVSGNIWEDPGFCDHASGDLSISETSPCAAGNNACGELMGALDVGCTGF